MRDRAIVPAPDGGTRGTDDNHRTIRAASSESGRAAAISPIRTAPATSPKTPGPR